jgi:hypothetical protein
MSSPPAAELASSEGVASPVLTDADGAPASLDGSLDGAAAHDDEEHADGAEAPEGNGSASPEHTGNGVVSPAPSADAAPAAKAPGSVAGTPKKPAAAGAAKPGVRAPLTAGVKVSCLSAILGVLSDTLHSQQCGQASSQQARQAQRRRARAWQASRLCLLLAPPRRPPGQLSAPLQHARLPPPSLLLLELPSLQCLRRPLAPQRRARRRSARLRHARRLPPAAPPCASRACLPAPAPPARR